MRSLSIVQLLICGFTLLFISCGIGDLLNALIHPSDVNENTMPIIPPTPICSSDSAIVQKLLDTNNLKLSVAKVASANTINRVIQINIPVWPIDSTKKIVDTLIMPEQICQLDSLQEIFLENLNMDYLKIPLKASKVSNVQVLLLASNNLKTIPANLSFFERLSNVHLHHNHIDTIATFNINCPNLKWLDLEENNLSTIPKDIYLLSKLKGLYLANNKINTLPLEIQLLDSLSVLTIYSNNLCNVPDSLSKMLDYYYASWESSQICK